MLGKFLPLVLLFLSLLSHSMSAQTFLSPDKEFKAVWVGEKNEGRIEIHRNNGKLMLLIDYSSPDGEHGYTLLKGEWTPDSRYFIYSMTNSGGHMPWNFPIDVYCRGDNKVRHLEEYLHGPISGAFTVVDTDSLVIQGLKDIPVGKPYYCRLSRLFPPYAR